MKRNVNSPQLNANVEWVNGTAFWTFYFVSVLLLWLVLSVTLPVGFAWTYVNLVHNVLTFYMLHWKLGSPVYHNYQGEYDKLTFWEQIDSGSQFTDNKKWFTVVPVILFIIASNSSNFEEQPLLLNVTSLLAVLIPKLPAMHTVRIFGINSATK